MTDPVLNIERLTILRDRIQTVEAKQFSMADWFDYGGEGEELPPQQLLHNCNTAGCIGGWAEAMFFPEDGKWRTWDEVAAALGLTRKQGDDLFFPNAVGDLTQAEAIETLTRLIATGEVDWSHSAAHIKLAEQMRAIESA